MVTDIWEIKCREHLDRQLFVKNIIVDVMFRKPQKSCRVIEVGIRSCCSHIAIDWFCKLFGSFGCY